MKVYNIAIILATHYVLGAKAFSIPQASTCSRVVVGTSSPRTILASATMNEETVLPMDTTVPKPKSYLDDGFVFGLENSGLERPKGKVAQIVVEGDSLETQPYQVAMVSTTFISHAAFLIYSIMQLHHLDGGNVGITALETFVTLFCSWVLADLGSGILHWSVDNYGNGKTPIMGGIIAAFQGHHSAPWTITERGFCNNVYKLCIPFGIPTVAAISYLAGPQHPLVTMFFTMFCAMEIMSQEFHKWSHMTKSQLPPLILALQKYGITIGRTPHAMHHLAPYEGNYSIISGICNDWLDKSGFFRRLEKIVYDMNGVESNAWKLDSALRERTLKGDYSLHLKVKK